MIKRCIVFLFLTVCCSMLVLAQYDLNTLRSKEMKTIDGKLFYIHQVKRGQTIYMISKAYEVDMLDVIRANPELNNGLKANTSILIPIIDREPENELDSHEEIREAEPVFMEDTLTEILQPDYVMDPLIPCGFDRTAKKESYKVALMMHFFLDDSESIPVGQHAPLDIAGYKSFRYIEFYEGFMKAVDSVTSMGMNLELFVYDVSADTAETRRFLKNPELQSMDMIIGLLFYRNFRLVANFARQYQIPIISPVSERANQVNGNPFVIKVRPSTESLYPQVAEYLSTHHAYASVQIVRNASDRSSESAEMLRRLLGERGITATISDGIAVLHTLTRGIENLVIIISDQKTIALNVIAQLITVNSDYELKAVGLPRWDQMDGMDYEYLDALNTLVASPYFIDYQDPRINQFVAFFQKTYHTDPTPLAFQGFDVGWFFLNALKDYGKTFPQCMNELTIKPLQTSFDFLQQNGNGYENQRWMLYQYKNFQRIPVD